MVLGAVERGGKLKTKVIPKTDIPNINQTLGEFVAVDSIMVTDALRFNKSCPMNLQVQVSDIIPKFRNYEILTPVNKYFYWKNTNGFTTTFSLYFYTQHILHQMHAQDILLLF